MVWRDKTETGGNHNAGLSFHALNWPLFNILYMFDKKHVKKVSVKEKIAYF